MNSKTKDAQEKFEVDGVVTECLPDAMFQVELVTMEISIPQT